MRKIISLFLLLYSFIVIAAEDKVLNVGVNHYTPPFIMRSGANGYYGFDISMLNYICRKINRECKFYSMPFNELIPSVEAGRVDVVVSALTITNYRAQFVRFSNPYILSYSRFLTSVKYKDEKFNRKFFQNKTIGVKKGSVFTGEIRKLNLGKVKIKQYLRDNQVIDALSQGAVDLVLTDNETASFWKNHSSGHLIAFGKAIKYGYGYGIAANKNDKELIEKINFALAQYHKSMHFQTNYTTYIANFPGS